MRSMLHTPFTTVLFTGGAMPVNKILKLETFRELGPEITYFLERRELESSM